MPNLPQALVAHQERVVRRFLPKDWRFLQIMAGVSHGTSIDNFIRSTAYDLVVLLDIDCIPLNAQAFERLAADANENQLVGCVQRASHIDNGGHLYAGPFCCAIDRRLYAAIGKPSARSTERADVGEQLTYACEEAGKSVKFLWPTAVEEPRWMLTDDIGFGIGTTYADDFWHLFEARFPHNRARFISKCREVFETGRRLASTA